jgi:dinuclear metal center YbgI/SA1388 family protein
VVNCIFLGETDLGRLAGAAKVVPMERETLVRHLDALLDAARCRDYGPNGLQVEGRSSINRLATAATASLAACRAAAEARVDALLVHHGLFWGKEVRITGMLRQRIGVLVEADISLIAYHLPLDAHAEVGNNAVLLELIGAGRTAPFAEHHGIDIGWIGELAEPVTAADFTARLERIFAHAVVHCPGDGRMIRRIGVVSGGGQGHLLDAAAAGCDALVTGEATEHNWHEAAETGCHLFACGHHATENIAVHRLGASLAREYGLEHVQLDLANPL